MSHLVEDNNLSVKEDSILPNGQIAKAGAKITVVSSKGTYNGFNMRVPPPEFEALMFFNALEAAANAELLKKHIKVSRSDFDKMAQIDHDTENMIKFFNMCQQSMAAVAFSISAIESWVNKSFVLHGQRDGKPIELIMSRPNKSDRLISADRVASDLGIPIRPKIFQLAPQIFKVTPLKEHSSLKQSIGDLVDERNIVMHMQAKLSLNNIESDRISYAVKLFKVNAFKAPENVLNYLNYIYDKSEINAPSWLEVANKELKSQRKRYKRLITKFNDDTYY